jgi:coenzyme F420-dependent glucose-6-phosphate dehydrogenase
VAARRQPVPPSLMPLRGRWAVASIWYHASHEQFSPAELLRLVLVAERMEFQGVMSSDHFYSWGDAQGQSGMSWAWLGAAMQATTLPFGVICAPTPRYHPAVVAQAAATLAEMFPHRIWLALGSGQALNEHITGDPWPAKSERNARLLEAASVIRALWRGETVSHHGRIVVDEARLYTRPERPPYCSGRRSPPTRRNGWGAGRTVCSPSRSRNASSYRS